jgi:uncharacterized protein (TIGR02596 family)
MTLTIQRRTRSKTGFTIMELLVVVAIIGIMVSLLTPALSGSIRAFQLRTGASGAIEALTVARQTAVTVNRAIQVRIYQKDGECFFQLFRIHEGGSQSEPLDRPFRLPESIAPSSNATWSSLLTDAVTGTETADSRGTYRSFWSPPDGTTNPAGSSAPTLTFLYRTESTKSELPANFVTLQIDLQTGILQTFRPL